MKCTRLLLILVTASCSRPAEQGQDPFGVLVGPYLGQEAPGDEPKIFAPGIVSNGMHNRDFAVMPTRDEIYFCAAAGPFAGIMVTKQIDGRWTEPEVAPFSRRFLNMEPCISADGERFLFLSNRPRKGEEERPGWFHQNIWVMDREGDGWSEPYDIGPPVNSDEHSFFPSLTKDGTLYFTRSSGDGTATICRSRWIDGKYSEPEKLPDQVNTVKSQYNACISPDETYLIFLTDEREDSYGQADYYVCFRNEDDTWTEPINLGERINSPESELSPHVTLDGKYFLFASRRSSPLPESSDSPMTLSGLLRIHNEPGYGSGDLYWVSTDVIGRLRPK